jgi:glycerol-3-phosphate dehydrogenase
MIANKIYDLIVVGGGVVGLAILRAATLEGYSCILVEKEEHLLSHASGSNSGIACTGVDASPGTLERALIRDSISQMRIFCKEHNIPTRPCGSLVASWPWDDGADLEGVLAESHEAGDTHACQLKAEEVKSMEPNLSDQVTGAVHIPGEVVLDPWIYSLALAVHAKENGAEILTNFSFDSENSHFIDGVWQVTEKVSVENASPPRRLKGRAVVNAAGLFADELQKNCIGRDRWTAKSRRGQYRIYSANAKTQITHPIQPIPTQRTKGIFVFSSIYDQIVVGPTALDQESKTDRSIDPKVAAELDEYAQKVIPGLDPESDCIGEYVGIRPGTDKRDYQIHLFPAEQWISVAGIRSTG